MTVYCIQLLFGVTLLLTVSPLLCLLLKKRSASSRHAILAVSLFGTLLIPLLLPLLPHGHWSVMTFHSTETVAVSQIAEPVVVPEPAVMNVMRPVAYDMPLIEPPTGARSVSEGPVPGESQKIESNKEDQNEKGQVGPLLTLRALVLGLWAVGTMLLLLRLFLSHHAAQKLLAKTSPLDETQLEPATRRLGIKKRVQLRQSEVGIVPFTIGVRRPVIVLPEAAAGWSDAERRAVLTHELSHVARKDVLGQWLAECVTAVYWFHPLVWLVCRQLRIEREIACDDLVVLAGEEPPVYASILLRLAAGLKNKAARRHSLGCTVAMARHHEVKKRIASILNPSVFRKPLGRFGTVILLITATACVALAAMLAPGEKTRNEDSVVQNADQIDSPKDGQEQSSPILKPEVDERMELMCIVFRLAGAEEYQYKAFEKYDDDINEYFTDFKNHDVIQYARQLNRPFRGNNVAHDRVVGFGPYLTIRDGHIQMTEDAVDRMIHGVMVEYGVWNKYNANKFAKLLDDFYIKSRFHEFFANHQEMYQKAIRQFETELQKFDLAWFDRYYGMEDMPPVRLILTMAQEDGGYHIPVTLADGRQEFYMLTGVDGVDMEGDAIFQENCMDILMLGYHMRLATPMIEKHYESLKKSAERFFPIISDRTSGFYQQPSSPKSILAAQLGYAVQCKYDQSHDRADKANYLLQNAPKKGLVWFPQLVSKLDEYEKNRDKYPTLDDFMPEIAKLQDSIVTDEFFEQLKQGDWEQLNAALQKTQQANEPVTQTALPEKIEFRLINAKEKTPVKDAKIFVHRLWSGGGIPNTTLQTDEQGMASLPSSEIESANGAFRCYVFKENYVNLELPFHPERGTWPVPSTIEVEMIPGITVGGKVVDDKGKPIPGAIVKLALPFRGNFRDMIPGEQPFSYASGMNPYSGYYQTDSEGNWVSDQFPPDLREVVEIKVRTPNFSQSKLWVGREFVPSDFPPEFMEEISDQVTLETLQNRTAVWTLTQGVTVRGKILDENGNPAKNASMSVSNYKIQPNFFLEGGVRANENGEFVFSLPEEMEVNLGIKAKGLAPEMFVMPMKNDMAPLEFRLKPGRNIRFRVTDAEDGKPLQNVMSIIHTGKEGLWLGNLLPQSDAEGRFSWDAAPEEPLRYDFILTGYDEIEEMELAPREEEHLIIMKKKLPSATGESQTAKMEVLHSVKIDKALLTSSIHGRLVDEEGKPLADVSITGIASKPQELMQGAYDALSFQGKTDAEGMFRFELYETGNVFLTPDSETHAMDTFTTEKRGDVGDIVVKKGVQPTVRLLSPDGQPVPNVWINLCRSDIGHATATSGLTDANGVCLFRPVLAGKYQIRVDRNPFGRLPAGITAAEEHDVPFAFFTKTVTIDSQHLNHESRASESVVVTLRFDHENDPNDTFITGYVFDSIPNGQGVQSLMLNDATRTENGVYRFEHVARDAEFDFRLGSFTKAYRYLLPDDTESRPLVNGTIVGPFQEDTEIGIVGLNAPTVTLRAVDENGKPLTEFYVDRYYPEINPYRDMKTVNGQVVAEPHALRELIANDPDRDFRGSWIGVSDAVTIWEGVGSGIMKIIGLQPNEEVVLLLYDKERRQGSVTLVLKEGEEKEITVTLKSTVEPVNESNT